MSKFTLEDLEKIIIQRSSKIESPSYTRELLDKGVKKIVKKLGEEATEAIIAALSENKENLIKESADLIYHLMVLLKSKEITLQEIYRELEDRTHQSGLEEKATRKE